MAKVIFSALVEDVRGKIGGNVFSRNANGSFVRGYSKPVNADSEAQQAVRNAFGSIARSWRELTDDQRKSFIDQAVNYPYNDSLGRPQVYTGFQLYQKVNSQLQLIGGDPLVVMPAPVEMNGIVNLTVNPSLAADFSATVSWVVPEGGVPGSTILVFQATRLMSTGIYRPKRQDFKNILALPSPNPSPFELLDAYTAVYGSPAIGSTIFIQAFSVSTITGQTSNVKTTQVTVTA